MSEKRPVAVASRTLMVALAVSIVIIVILVVSGFNKVNPFLLLASLCVAAFVVYYFTRKPKVLDIYKMKQDLQKYHYQKFNSFLDFEQMQVIPVTDSITHFYLPYEGRTFEFNGSRIVGLQARHILKVIREQEKSRLFESAQKAAGAHAQLKSVSDSLGIDPASVGLE